MPGSLRQLVLTSKVSNLHSRHGRDGASNCLALTIPSVTSQPLSFFSVKNHHKGIHLQVSTSSACSEHQQVLLGQPLHLLVCSWGNGSGPEDSSLGAAGQAEAEPEGPPARGQAITGCLKSPGSCILSVMILKQRESPVHSTGLAAPRPQPAHHAGMAAGTRTGSHRRQQHQLVKSEPGSDMEGEVPAAGLMFSLAAAQKRSKSLLLQ